MSTRIAIAAALAAWPGAVKVYKSADEVSADLILPLPQEAPQERVNQENTNAES